MDGILLIFDVPLLLVVTTLVRSAAPFGTTISDPSFLSVTLSSSLKPPDTLATNRTLLALAIDRLHEILR